jgi:hypothetical protein
MQIELQSMAIAMPAVMNHPNRAPFRGVLTLVGVASDRPPAGARGHRVILTRAATEKALPSLLGMGLDYAPSLDRHDARRKVGVITEANLRDSLPLAAFSWRPTSGGGKDREGASALEVNGYLYAKDFPEVVQEVRAGGRQKLGMSYEIADARVAEINAPVWEITDFAFTGAALLRRDKAAYRGTWIELE